jgi:hypothetical protein
MFLRLLFNSMVWQVQQSNNGNPNLNIFILDDFVQVFHASLDVHVPMVPSQHTPMQSIRSIKMLPPSSLNTPLI